MAPKSRFASRGAFDALALEDSDAEQDQSVEEQREAITPEPTAVTTKSDTTPSKNTRSSRRAAKRSVAKSSEVTDSDGDLEVMTTRSGGRIRQPSVPNIQENTESTPQKVPASNGVAKEMIAPKISISQADSAPVMASPPKPPYFLTQKVADETPSHAQMLEKKKDDDIEARKMYWKKIYERTIFTFIMIGGFIGEWYTLQHREHLL